MVPLLDATASSRKKIGQNIQNIIMMRFVCLLLLWSSASGKKVELHKRGLNVRGGGLWQDYQSALEKKPILTKATTSLVGFGFSDALTQVFIEKQEFKVMRLIKMASFGFLLHGTTGHFFYNFLDSVMSGATPLFVAAKVAIDQTL